MNQRNRQQRTGAFLLISLVCISLCLSLVVFSSNGNKVQQEEASRSLEVTAESACNALTSEIDGNLQILITLASSIGYESNGHIDSQALLHDSSFLARLDVVSSQNEFLRMGVVDLSYSGNFVQLDGNRELAQDLTGDVNIQAAMSGTATVSASFWDEDFQCYVNRYAVPIYDTGTQDGVVIGVLTGSNRTEDLLSLLDTRLMNDSAIHVYVMNSEGRFVVYDQTESDAQRACSLLEREGVTSESRQLLADALSAEQAVSFTLDYNGVCYQISTLPLNIHDWHVLCAVPQAELVSDISHWFSFQRITFLAIFAALLVLSFYIYRIVRQNNRTMYRLAYFDSVTGAYNRVRFLAELPQRLTDRPQALAVLEVNNTASLKNLYGLERFNDLLCHIKGAFDDHLRPHSMYCMGRRERFLLLLDADTPEGVQALLEPVLKQIRLFRVSERQNFQIACSVGVRFVTREQTDLERAITEAAMTAETSQGQLQDEILFFDPHIYEPEILRAEIEGNMEQALAEQQFSLFLQPKIDPQTGRIGGAEALVRWMQNGKVRFFPDQFIPIFERNGFCVELDFYMVEQVCRALHQWLEAGYPVVPVSINQCRQMLYEDHYMDRLCAILEKWQIPPRLLVLEVTERSAMTDPDRMRTVLLEVRRRGLSVAMDDFGSGYSSLNTLKDLPIDELKLDRVFLSTLDRADEEKRDQILKHVICLAQDLHMTTVMEGVETSRQLEFIRALHCDLVQGYYYDKPLPAEEFAQKYCMPHPER